MLKLSKSSKRYKSPSHRHSPEQEKSLAKKLGGKEVKGSGCGMYQKGDVIIEDLLRIECKSTINKSFSITRKILDKIDKATQGNQLPVVQIDFINRESGKLEKSCYVVETHVMENLIDKAKNN